MSELKTENLTVAYKSRKSAVTAIDGLTAVFPSDSFNVIVGYSGCGKTTLLKSVLGLLGYSGHIFFDGEQIDGKDVNKRNFSYVSQEYALYSHLTVFDNIAFPLKVMGADKTETRKRVGDVAAMFDIAHCLTRKPKHLSGGQQQRVAIARALIKRPRLCLFDEPLSNIDPDHRVKLRVELKKSVIQTGCSALYVTHDFTEAMALADRLFVMDGGRIAASGAPQEIFDSGNAVVESLKPRIDDEIDR